MNEQSPINDNPSQLVDRSEARRQRREARRAALGNPSRGGSWVAGLILILLGAAFLLRNTGTFNVPLKNWWALFILIPAVGAFDTAIRLYRTADNQLTAPARGSLLVGLVLTFITISFLFNLNMAVFGPVIIILVGMALLAGTLFGRE
jgi:hypothetical protein